MITPELVAREAEDERDSARHAPLHGSRRRPHRWWIVLLIVLAAVATALLGVRTWKTLSMLTSAYEAGVPHASTVRPWMTIRYVSTTYRIGEVDLRSRLGLAPGVPSETTLKALAHRAHFSPMDYARQVQRAIGASKAETADNGGSWTSRWFESSGDGFIAAVLVYGYPAIAATLMLGALGLPLPSGLSMVVAGSLAANGLISWPLAAAVATASSVVGDLAGYGVGRGLGSRFVDRWGHWLGLTPLRRVRLDALFERWGAFAVLLSRSLLSVLSSAVNLVAGAGRYRLAAFFALTIVGRAIWTSAYLGLGYVGSAGLEPASDFLASLTGLLVSLALLAGLLVALRRRGLAAGSPA